MKDYNTIAFDAQYFLVRNFKALKSRQKCSTIKFLPPEVAVLGNNSGEVITEYDFTAQDLIKQFFWSIVKVIREIKSCNKIILLWDKAPYHKSKITSGFKKTRAYHTQENLDEWDVEEDPAGYLQEVEEIRIEQEKQKAKYWLISNLHLLGMTSIIHSGYEADDLAYIFSTQLPHPTPDAICSADSDWEAWTAPGVDFINFNKKKSFTYDEICNGSWEGYPNLLKMSLFEVKSYADSLYMSHNDLIPTSSVTWKTLPKAVDHIKSGDYSDVDDVEQFNLNMKTFDILSYPEIDKVKSSLETALNNSYTPDLENYHKLRRDGFRVSESYVSKYFSLIS